MRQEENNRPRGTSRQLATVTAITCARAPMVLLAMVGVAVDMLWPDWLAARGFAIPLRVGCLALMALSAITDLFDGMFARKWNVTSKFGAICDPLMDKVFFVVVFPTVTAMLFLVGDVGQGVLMLFFTVLHVLRDLWVVTLRSLAVGKADMRANFVGKLRTFVSFPIGMLVYAHVAFSWPWLPRGAMVALETLGIALNLYSLVVYTKRYGFAVKDAINSEK